MTSLLPSSRRGREEKEKALEPGSGQDGRTFDLGITVSNAIPSFFARSLEACCRPPESRLAIFPVAGENAPGNQALDRHALLLAFEHFEYCVCFDAVLEWSCDKIEGENHDRADFREV